MKQLLIVTFTLLFLSACSSEPDYWGTEYYCETLGNLSCTKQYSQDMEIAVEIDLSCNAVCHCADNSFTTIAGKIKCDEEGNLIGKSGELLEK